MKKGKHVSSKADTREIVKLGDYQEPEVSFVYDDEEEAEREARKKGVPKAVYRVGAVLIVVMVGLALWMNRDSLKPENAWSWVVEQMTGARVGDGFPVSIPGSTVLESNFSAAAGSAAILSDTAFTLLGSDGKESLSLRHSFNNPAMNQVGTNFLLYNSGSTGYVLQSGEKTLCSGNAGRDILSGAVSGRGRYALGMQGSEGASDLEVYDSQGELLYTYLFAQDYITAMALNYDGSYGAVATVKSEKGELISKITILDFSKTEKITEYTISGNLILGMYWSQNGNLYAVGDSGLLMASSSNYEFQNYSYDGRQITAYCLASNRAFVSVSAYAHRGASTLLVFDGSQECVKVDTEKRITSISCSGGTVGTLEDNEVVFYDFTTGQEQARADGGADARSLALSSEHSAYVMGINEVRMLEVE